jgi:hypothetical protein
MANRNFDFIQGLGKGVKVISGSFAPNGALAVAASSIRGKGFSVARTSVGLFTITLQDAYVACLSMTASLQLAAADDQFVQIGAIDVVTARTIQIRVWDVSALAVGDVAANANNRINFVLVLSNSQLNA